MSAGSDRTRRELGVELAYAGCDACVDAPLKQRIETSRQRADLDDALMYFTSLEQFDAWYRTIAGQ
jgi:hypothetical protein